MIRRFGPPLALLLALVVLWEIYVRAVDLDPVTLPAPSRILGALWDFRAAAAGHLAPTLVETLVGIVVSVVLAIAAAVALDRWSPVRRAVEPLLVASQTIPIVAIAPLFVIWFGFGLLPKVSIVVLVTFFPVTIVLLDGFGRVGREATDLMRSIGATPGQVFRMLRWPAALPYLFTGLRISVVYAVIGAIFGEYVGATQGLGIWMQLSQNSFRTDLVFGRSSSRRWCRCRCTRSLGSSGGSRYPVGAGGAPRDRHRGPAVRLTEPGFCYMPSRSSRITEPPAWPRPVQQHANRVDPRRNPDGDDDRGDEQDQRERRSPKVPLGPAADPPEHHERAG